jgi:pimeloyl-ACP methyl ester carboxylesterase
MATSAINGVRIFWEDSGAGAPLVLVHGSWGDHHNWDAVVPALARTFHVFTYDRRGHSLSERPAAQGSIEEDVADLAAFVKINRLAPAHIIGNSFGAAITLKLAVLEPDLFASMTVHEPPLIGMLDDDRALAAVGQRIASVLATLRAGDQESGARQFVEEVALGPGTWERLPPEIRRTFVFNASTFLDEQNEPIGAMAVDLTRLAKFGRPTLITRGDQSPPFFGIILEKVAAALPHAQRHTFRGGGHVPHLTHADEYVSVVTEFINAVAARP